MIPSQITQPTTDCFTISSDTQPLERVAETRTGYIRSNHRSDTGWSWTAIRANAAG